MHTHSPLFLVILCSALPLVAAEEDLRDNLGANSPFLPHDYVEKSTEPSRPAPVAPSPTLKLKGIMDSANGPIFSIFDETKNESTWVSINDPKSPYQITDYDPIDKIITLTYQGRRQQLQIEQPNDSPIPISSGSSRRLRSEKESDSTLLNEDQDSFNSFEDQDEFSSLGLDKEELLAEFDQEYEDPELAAKKKMKKQVAKAFKKYLKQKRMADE